MLFFSELIDEKKEEDSEYLENNISDLVFNESKIKKIKIEQINKNNSIIDKNINNIDINAPKKNENYNTGKFFL